MIPDLIHRDVNEIVADMVAYYQNATGKVLAPADVERLIFDCFAYREGVIRSDMQGIVLQLLVATSKAPIIDFLGELVGVTRLSGTPARATLRFTFEAGHIPVSIPEGMRVQSEDGSVIFQVLEQTIVQSSDTTKDILAIAQTAGAIGNGFAISKINNILDPLPYLISASNPAVSVGGADQETDEQLRERIKLAPSKFSTAGPRKAYKAFAREASPLIIDVAVVSPTPGTVEVFPMIAGALETPEEILAAVRTTLNDEDVRPLTDTVIVTSPTSRPYHIDIELTLFKDAVTSDTIDEVIRVVGEYVNYSKSRMGVDVLKNRIVGLCMSVFGGKAVYNVTLPDFTDVIVGPTEYAYNLYFNTFVTAVADE